MKKLWFILLCAVAGSIGVFAQSACPENPWPEGRPGLTLSGPYAKEELSAIKADLGDQEFGDLSIARLSPYWTRLNLALSKDQYLEETSKMSLIMPGAGQFKNGDTSEGIGFLSLHLAVVTGTLTGFYFLLPADLRFNNLDYLDTSLRDINDAWQAHSIRDYLPSIGVLMAGAVLDMGIRYWASREAYAGARAAVESGRAELKPVLGPGYLGFGMAF